MKYEAGHGFQGTLLFDGKTDKVQCHYCGNWFDNLAPHLRKDHGTRADEYKRDVGLAPKAALISESFREKLLRNVDSRIETLKKVNEQNREKFKNKDFKKKWSKKHSEGMKKYRATMEFKNQKGTCPEQLLDRLKKLAQEQGRTPQSKYVTFYEALVKTYGSYKEACRLAGLEYRGVGVNISHSKSHVYRWSREELLEKLRHFRKVNGRDAHHSDCQRKLLPAYNTYVRRFGTFARAITLSQETNDPTSQETNDPTQQST